MGDQEIAAGIAVRPTRNELGQRDGRGVGRHRRLPGRRHRVELRRYRRLLEIDALDDRPRSTQSHFGNAFPNRRRYCRRSTSFAACAGHERRQARSCSIFARPRRRATALRSFASFANDIEQQHRHSGIGHLCGDPRAHRRPRRSPHTRLDVLLDLLGVRHHSRSMHRGDALAAADALRGQRIAAAVALAAMLAALPTIRAPVAPSGWPRAMAPPSMFSFWSRIQPQIGFMQASDCAGKGLVQFDHIVDLAACLMPARASAPSALDSDRADAHDCRARSPKWPRI